MSFSKRSSCSARSKRDQVRGNQVGSRDCRNPLTVGAGGIDQQAVNTESFSTAQVILGAAQTWTLGSGAGTLYLGSGLNTNGYNLAIDAGTTGGQGNVLSSAISGSGSLSKIDGGVLTLMGASTYTGTTTVSGGTLAIGAGGSLSGGGSVLVSTGAALAISGTGSLSMGSTFVVGVSGTGTFTQTGGTFTTNGGELRIADEPGSTGTYNLNLYLGGGARRGGLDRPLAAPSPDPPRIGLPRWRIQPDVRQLCGGNASG